MEDFEITYIYVVQKQEGQFQLETDYLYEEEQKISHSSIYNKIT